MESEVKPADASEHPIVHTPGPWTYESYGAIVMAHGGAMSVADVRGFGRLEKELGTPGALKTMDANGRLMAASPDLLEGLEHMRWCRSCAEGSWEDCEGGRLAIEALSKATGKKVV